MTEQERQKALNELYRKAIEMKKICIYHSADPDGIFSGAIVKMRFPEAELIGYNYEPCPDEIIQQCKGATVYVVDICLRPWGAMEKLAEMAKQVIWIDHHKTQYQEYIDKGKQYEGLHVIYNPGIGACQTVWQTLFQDDPVPTAISLAAQYDVFMHYGTASWDIRISPFRYSSGMIRTPEAVLLETDNFSEEKTKEMIEQGRIMKKYAERQDEILVHSKQAFKSIFQNKYSVLALSQAVHGDMFKSREDMAQFDFVVGFHYTSIGWKVNLRSEGKMDVGEIAQQFGGGGDKNAAGFYCHNWRHLKDILYIPEL